MVRKRDLIFIGIGIWASVYTVVLLIFNGYMHLIINDSGWPYFPYAIPGEANWRTIPLGVMVKDIYHSLYGRRYFSLVMTDLLIITLPLILLISVFSTKKTED